MILILFINTTYSQPSGTKVLVGYNKATCFNLYQSFVKSIYYNFPVEKAVYSQEIKLCLARGWSRYVHDDNIGFLYPNQNIGLL